MARIFLTEGTGQITINGQALDAYFTEAKDRNAVVGPLASPTSATGSMR